jgi:hypothetical protein
MNALALAYQHEERPFTESQIMQDAFDILTASRAKEVATKQVLSAVEKNQRRISTPPNRRSGSPKEPATREEADAAERRAVWEAMVEHGLASPDSESPFSQK